MSADSYQLGVDVGTTWTAAAVARGGQILMVGLGNRSAAIPSVVHLGADGSVLVGEAAERRAVAEPERVAREFKRRLGDPTPLRLGDTACTPDMLLGTLLDAVVARVSELEGGPPSQLVVTRPANWGGYKQDLFEECVTGSQVAQSSTVSEPEAAAIAYAANERVAPGSLIAVYDLGGGTFDVAIMRKTSDGFSILGRPEGVERLGGLDVDEAVIGHVRTALGDAIDDLDLGDPATVAALTRLRRDCVEAKEALSSDTEATIPVLLPGVQTDVRLTRAELEQAIRPALETSIDAMRRALAAAAIMPEHLSTVLLVGGSSRIPLVAELVSEAFGRPVALDTHPKHAVATGAALVAAMEAQAASVSGEARVIPFATAGATGAYDDQANDMRGRAEDDRDPRTTTAPRSALPTAGAATVAGAGVAGRGVAGRGDGGTDVPDDVPDWLREARADGRPSTGRRLFAGVLAVVALIVVAAGAGALSARSAQEPSPEHSVAQPEAQTSEPASGHAREAVAGTGSDDRADRDGQGSPTSATKRGAGASGPGAADGAADADEDAGPVTTAAGGEEATTPAPSASSGGKQGGAAPSPSPSPTAGSGGAGGDGSAGGTGGGAAPSPSPSPRPGDGGGDGDGSGAEPGAGDGSGSGGGTGDGSGGGSGDGDGGDPDGGGVAPGTDADAGTSGSGPAVPVAQG